MPVTLESLTEEDIRALATPAVFARGEDYYAEGRVRPGRREAGGLTAEVRGTRLYEVRARESRWGLIVDCTCPYAWSRTCKHGVATLLAWLHQPTAFADVEGLRRALARRKKAELVDLLLQAAERYPDLPRALGIAGSGEEDPERALETLLASAGTGDWWRQAGRAAELAEGLRRGGRQAAARRAYFQLLLRSLEALEADGVSPPDSGPLLEALAEGYRAAVMDDPDRYRDAATIEEEVEQLQSHPASERAELYFDAVWDFLEEA